MESIRCGTCGAVLFRLSLEALRGPLEIKRRRCGTINRLLRATNPRQSATGSRRNTRCPVARKPTPGLPESPKPDRYREQSGGPHRRVPGLKLGAYLAGSDTGVPVLGLRPTRARRKRTEKLPKLRISIRPPPERHAAMCSSIMFTANATSRSTRWDCVCAIRWISRDFVIRPLSHRRRWHVVGRAMMPTTPLEAVSQCRFGGDPLD